MATYKVLQDIEADDKLLGPLSLKQFIFAAVFVGIGVIAFFIATSPAPFFLKIPFVAALLPPMVLFGFLAAPFSHDQPNEIWLLARISFLFRPRNRIWSQDGVKELVTVTAPKKIEHVYTNGMSQTEVKSRLQALANTVDSRGWAIKNINTNLFAQPGYLNEETSDRLVGPSELPQDVPATDITASDDMLDITSNTTAQHLDQLVQQATASHRQQAISAMKPDPQAPVTPANYWFMNQGAPAPQIPVPADYSVFQNQQVVAPGTADVHPAAAETAEEHDLAEKLAAEHKEAVSHISDHMRIVQPLHELDGQKVKAKPEVPKAELNPVDPIAALTAGSSDINNQTQPMPQANPPQDQSQNSANPAKMGLAFRDDWTVSNVAREAKRLSEDSGEVVISLH